MSVRGYIKVASDGNGFLVGTDEGDGDLRGHPVAQVYASDGWIFVETDPHGQPRARHELLRKQWNASTYRYSLGSRAGLNRNASYLYALPSGEESHKT